MDFGYFGTSPQSVTRSPLADFDQKSTLSMEEFIHELPRAIVQRKQVLSTKDPIITLFEKLEVDPIHYESFAHFDVNKNYTRNLIATDEGSYSLVLLCWNPLKESPIHDHPCDGCWMRVLEGSIRECRYQESHHGLSCTDERIYDEGDIAYIEDSFGFHKIGNPFKRGAITLHLYSPPIKSCRYWINEEQQQPLVANVCNYSEYGKKI